MICSIFAISSVSALGDWIEEEAMSGSEFRVSGGEVDFDIEGASLTPGEACSFLNSVLEGWFLL